MAPPSALLCVVLVVLALLLAVLVAASKAARAPPGPVRGGAAGPRPWWDAPVDPAAQAAVRRYARRSILPSLQGRDRGPFDKGLQAALRCEGPRSSKLAGLGKLLLRSKLASSGAGRGEAGRAKARADEIIGLLPPGASGPYLDLGCGDGTITKAVAACLGGEAVCIEVGPRPRGFPKTVRRVDAAKTAALGDGEFGVVTALMSLHHVPEPEATAKELARVTRPGGTLVVREHDLDNCLGRARPKVARQYLDWIHIMYDLAEGLEPPQFQRSMYRVPAAWSALLAEAGFAEQVVTLRGDRVCSYYATYLRE
jgi:SAM-dependent methyltransferase